MACSSAPVSMGTIYDDPNEESVVAAKICLEGCSLVGDSLYFVNPVVGVSDWFAESRNVRRAGRGP